MGVLPLVVLATALPQLNAFCLKQVRLTLGSFKVLLALLQGCDKYFDKVEIRNLRTSLDKANEALRRKGVPLEMTAANLAAHTLRCGGDSLAMHPDDVVTEVVILEEPPGAKRKPVEHEQLGDQPLKRRSARLLGAGAELGLGGSVAL